MKKITLGIIFLLLNASAVGVAQALPMLIKAPGEDLELAGKYSAFPDKGILKNGQRITIMTKKTRYKTGETVRVLHALEAVGPAIQVYVMGPKKIYDEYVDGKLSSTAGKSPESYDGVVLDRPAVDFNYDVTTYAFSETGDHFIQWKGGGHPIQGPLGLESNIIKIRVTQDRPDPEQPPSPMNTAEGERVWSRSDILSIAGKEAGRLGYDIKQMSVSFDSYNSKWNDYLGTVHGAQPKQGIPLSVKEKLENREYWAVYYAPLKMMPGGDLWIFVDRQTGEIITTILGQ